MWTVDSMFCLLLLIFNCFRANDDVRPSPIPMLKEIDGRYSLNKGLHCANCFLWDFNELQARDIDRGMRKEVDSSQKNPQEAWKEGQKKALMLAKDLEQNGKEANSVAILYPSWHTVRNIYYRRRRLAASTVKDPFKPPAMYRSTYRAFVMKNEEK